MTPMQPGMDSTRHQEQGSERGLKLDKSREVRLGLVLYGGVSLAIYINGVCNEFFRAVRGRGVYRLIKALTDSEVVVDVISGTSAGGINGIFLAFCLCNEKSEFGRSARLWREQGDILKLLRGPEDRKAHVSLLDSEGYYQPELQKALARMYASPGPHERDEDAVAEEPSRVNELDLFVTGTDVDGSINTQFDDAGHPIDVKDYRSVFLLKHREGRKAPFSLKPPKTSEEEPHDNVTVKALAKLACITSCFPSAFAPVQVALKNGDPRHARPAQEDEELERWGRLARERDRCFLDGGVLDNKPFSYTLRTIFSRHALCEVDRKLCYVEPVPESFAPAEQASQPDILDALLTALIGIPRYESIGEDLKALADHNSRVQQYNRILSELQNPSEATPDQQVLYRRSRLVALSERILRGIFRVKGRDVPISLQDQDTRRRAAALVRCFDEVDDPKHGVRGIDVAHILDSLDVTFRLRRLYHTVYRLHDLLYDKLDDRLAPVPAEQVPRYRLLWHVLNRHIELHEILLAGLNALVDQAPIDWRHFEVEKSRAQARALWDVVQLALERLLDDTAAPGALLPREYRPEAGSEWLSTGELKKFDAELKKQVGSILEEMARTGRPATKPTGTSLLHRIDAWERSILEHFISGPTDPAAPVRQAYERFPSLDTLLYPLELMGGLNEKDVIETIRLSPRDAQEGFSARPAAKKLSGDLAHHFGGFFKRSWRANDILWGRLDGLCQLVEFLLTPERLARLTSNKALLEKVRRRMLKSPAAGASPLHAKYDPAGLFPLSGEATHQQLRDWLQQLLSTTETERTKALEPTRFKEMRNLLIEAAQLEVLDKELRNVLEDKREEQKKWTQSKLVRGNEAKTLDEKLREMERQLEQRPRGVASNASSPADTALGSYFKEGYDVGDEKFPGGVPTLVLLDIASKAMPVLRNGLLKIVESRFAGAKRTALWGVIQTAGALAKTTQVVLALQQRVSRLRLPLTMLPWSSPRATPRTLPEGTSAPPPRGTLLSRLLRPVRALWSGSRPPREAPQAG